jgi:hypothetical protein
MLPTRGRLYLNVDAEGGRAMVECRDLEGKSIPGFARDDCDPIEVDSTAAKVSWRGNPVTAGILGIPIVIHFHLRNATLYSMRFKRTGDASDPVERALADMEAAYREAPLGEEREAIKDRMVEYLSGLGD